MSHRRPFSPGEALADVITGDGIALATRFAAIPAAEIGMRTRGIGIAALAVTLLSPIRNRIRVLTDTLVMAKADGAETGGPGQ